MITLFISSFAFFAHTTYAATNATGTYCEWDGNGTLTFKYGEYEEDDVIRQVSLERYVYDFVQRKVLNRNWNDLASSITTVVFDPSFKATNIQYFDYWFYACEKLTNMQGIENINATNLESMQRMFYNCSSLQDIKSLADLDVSHVNNMNGSFFGCSQLTSLDGLKQWQVGAVITMASLFAGCSNLTSLDALSDWKTNSLQFMTNMCSGDQMLSSLGGLADWDVSHLDMTDNSMEAAFEDCINLRSLDALAHWSLPEPTQSSFTMGGPFDTMFSGCTGLVSIDAISNWKLPTDEQGKVVGVTSMFQDCTALSSLTITANFKLDTQVENGMSIPDTTGTDTLWWSPDAVSGVSTSDMTKDTSPKRWIRTSASTNPFQTAVTPEVTWGSTTVSYTGMNQKILPTSVKVNGVDLQEGIDYYVTYKKDGEQTESPVVNEPGTYTASVYLQGKYIPAQNPSAQHEVQVGEPGPTPGPTPAPTPTPEPHPELPNTWFPTTDGRWYFVDENGNPVTDAWKVIDDKTYRFDSEGYALQSEWYFENGTWYYFGSDCAMQAGNWLWIDNAWYAFMWDGSMCIGWFWDNYYVSWYYAYSDGAVAYGSWNWIDGAWYGFNWDCSMCRGWVWDNSYAAWYYCDWNSGYLYTNCWIGDTWWWADSSGVCTYWA